jgi:TRAP-type C4-dicarboxylate transport system permease small subunit
MGTGTPLSGRPAFGLGARFVRLLVAACIGVGGLALAAMMLHVCLDIFLREALGIVVPGALEAVSFFYMVACICLAFPIMQVAGEQVVVEVFMQMLSQAALKPFELLGALLTLVYVTYLCVAGVVGAWEATQAGEMQLVGDADWIVWPSRWVSVAGLAITAIVVLWQLWRVWSQLPSTMLAETDGTEGDKL